MNALLKEILYQLKSIYSYRHLIICFVQNDLKVKYRRSILGFFWSLLHPLLMMSVMAVAFTKILKFRSEDYMLYLLCSLLPWSFLVESLQSASGSIIASENLIRTQYLPKIIFPIRQIIFQTISFSFSLISLLGLFSLLKMEFPTKFYYLFLSIPILAIFTAGLGVILSIITVYLRDVQYLLGVILKAWFYVTPILYPLEILPPEYQTYLLLNPATHFLQLFTEPLYKDISPGIATYGITLGLTFCSLFLGLFMMTRYEKKLIFRL